MEEQKELISKAAELIIAADFLIVATGAGLSADSGLPVYRDTQKVEAYLKRGLSYMDLCRPNWNFKEPETFYGFWGSSMKQFREAVPHEGYVILKKWKEQLFSVSSEKFKEKLMKYGTMKDVTNPPGPAFVYTSNVDALHLKAGFHKNEIYEIHGNIETWQCSMMCTSKTWSAPNDFVFKVDPITMLAEKEEHSEKLHHSENNGFVSNHPKCIVCGDYSRPAILMFGDHRWVRNPSLWEPWRGTVSDLLQHDINLKAVIVEIGCGKNVPSVRCMGEAFVDYYPEQCNIIRINRDFIQPDFTKNPERVLGILGSGKTVLQAIDDVIQSKLAHKNAAEGADLQPTNLQPVDVPAKPDSEDEELAYEMQMRAKLE
eukprot:Phypoly_transcript_08580.p1 GENE.Phypoly_transcript_08580~~Phypoly_transcript_08580.p1  ORF type:complete len:372 (+),score=52.99 Phypoly_transcript_08580:132-1247(+)